MNKSLSIIYEQTTEAGFGHYSRSQKLANYMRGQGIDTQLINIADIDCGTALPTETVIYDISFKTNEKANELCAKTKLSIGLDWFQPIQVDHNILVYAHQNASARIKTHIGFEYIIIEDAIRQLPPINPEAGLKNVLVLIGGGDLNGDSIRAGDLLHEQGFHVHVVLGALAKKPTENRGYKISYNISDVAKAISDADLMITNGGNCLFEALAAGRPAIALAQTVAEERIIAKAKKSNAVLGTELNAINTDIDIDGIIANGRKLVDGAGTQRILNMIKHICR